MKITRKQREYITDPHQFVVCCWSRRTGKTVAAVIRMMTKAGSMRPGSNIVVLAKTNDQVRLVWMPMIKELFPNHIKKITVQPATVILTNNVSIHMRGGNDDAAVDSVRGMSLQHAVVDEAAFLKNAKYAINDVIMPALGDSEGSCDFISSPNGRNDFYDLYNRGLSPEHISWSSHHADYTSAFNKDAVAKMAEETKRTADPVTFAREWMASFEGSGKRVYYSFNIPDHSSDKIQSFQPGETVCVGIDFNIGIQASVVFAVRGSTIEVIDELHGFTNTQDLADEIVARYAQHKIIAYPDPAGRQNRTSAGGRTDFTILENAGITCYAKKSTRSIMDGVNNVNAALTHNNLIVHSRCERLIKSLDRLAWKENTSTPKYADDDLSHFCDALRYPIDYELGINNTKLQQIKVRGL